jgi:uncharacterized tellurite resistance protein B-like protein
VIGRLRALVRQLAGPAAAGPEASEDRVPLAMAALLVEAARADHRIEEVELEELGMLLARRLELPPEAARDLVHRARDAVEGSVSLYEFTRPLHEALDYRQKLEFVSMLWHVALADRRLDKYEDYLVGKVSELLYVARGDVIRLRNAVLEKKQAADGGD